jgi:acyl dehydratase
VDDEKPMAQIVISGIAKLKERVGKEVAVTAWLTVSQSRSDAFAAANGDDQWIHVDRERSVRESP